MGKVYEVCAESSVRGTCVTCAVCAVCVECVVCVICSSAMCVGCVVCGVCTHGTTLQVFKRTAYGFRNNIHCTAAGTYLCWYPLLRLECLGVIDVEAYVCAAFSRLSNHMMHQYCCSNEIRQMSRFF